MGEVRSMGQRSSRCGSRYGNSGPPRPRSPSDGGLAQCLQSEFVPILTRLVVPAVEEHQLDLGGVETGRSREFGLYPRILVRRGSREAPDRNYSRLTPK